MVEHREEEKPGALVGDPRRGGSRLCTEQVVITYLFFVFNWVYKRFKENTKVFMDYQVMRVYAESHFNTHYNEQVQGKTSFCLSHQILHNISSSASRKGPSAAFLVRYRQVTSR